MENQIKEKSFSFSIRIVKLYNALIQKVAINDVRMEKFNEYKELVTKFAVAINNINCEKALVVDTFGANICRIFDWDIIHMDAANIHQPRY